MTVASPAPPAPAVPATLSPAAAISQAFRLIRRYPAAVLMPTVVVQLPLAVLTAIATAILYTTVFANEPYNAGGLYGVDEAGGPVLAFAVVLAINALFTFVGHAATVVAIAAAAEDKPLSLAQSLDPAFTRMGALLALAVMLVGGAGLLAVSVFGIVVLPYFALRFGLSFATLMLERLSPTRALVRSWTLMKGNLWRFAGAVALTFLIFVPLLILRSLPLWPADASRELKIGVDAFATILGGVIAIPFAAIGTGATTLFYLNLKAREDARNPARI